MFLKKVFYQKQKNEIRGNASVVKHPNPAQLTSESNADYPKTLSPQEINEAQQ